MTKFPIAAGSIMLVAFAGNARAQSAPAHRPVADSSTGADASRPRLAVGATMGALRWSDGRSEQGLSATLLVRPRPWLSLSVNPVYVRASDSTGSGTSPVSGVADLPIEIAASHAFHRAWSPTLDISMDVALPIGDTATGLGTGETSLGAGLGVGLSPLDYLSFSFDAGRTLSGAGANSLLDASNATWIDGEASVDLASHATITLGYDADLSAPDSLQSPARSIAGGVEVPLRGAWALTVDGSGGMTRAAPSWSLAIGIGTVFNGLTPTNPFQRLRNAFGRSLNRGHGRGHLSGTSNGSGRGHV